MSQWLGSWDSQATGVYRHGVELSQEAHQESLSSAMEEAHEKQLSRFPILNAIVFVIFFIVIAGLLAFPEMVISIFY